MSEDSKSSIKIPPEEQEALENVKKLLQKAIEDAKKEKDKLRLDKQQILAVVNTDVVDLTVVNALSDDLKTAKASVQTRIEALKFVLAEVEQLVNPKPKEG